MSNNQQTISSYFSAKRRTEPIDLTILDEPGSPDTERHTKRLKIDESDGTRMIKKNQSGSRKNELNSPLPSLAHWAFLQAGPSLNVTSSTDVSPEDVPLKPSKNASKVKSMTLREKLLRRDVALQSDERLKETELVDMEPELEPANSKQQRRLKGNGKARIGPRGIACTPLEEVVLQFKEKYPDIVLLIQVGYKFCFFGEDAAVAGKVLGFYYGWDRNFLRTSCPVHNLKINVKKLVAAGYKVGVVTQIETAALKKAGENRNALFDRQLTQLYTPSTFVDDLDIADDLNYETPALMVLVENTTSRDTSNEKPSIGILNVVPSTGDVLYDQFQDNSMRTELETRMAHIRPSELLLSPSLSRSTEKILQHFERLGHAGRIRIEKLKRTWDYSEAFQYISQQYEKGCGELSPSITELPELVIISLALALKHLTSFRLTEALLQPDFFHSFSSRSYMLLNSSTIRNLEVFQNQTDFTERGSLFSIMDRTSTLFGKRLLRSWLGRPVIDRIALKERSDAVEELRKGETPSLALLRGSLRGLPDLSKALANIQYGRCMPKELFSCLTAFKHIGITFPAFDNPDNVGCEAALWRDIIFPLPKVKDPAEQLLHMVKIQAARDNNKLELWVDPEQYPNIEEAEFAILHVESDLADELKKIRKLLKSPNLDYVAVLNDEFLIEVPKARAKDVPANWIRMGSTKNVLRFHSPEIIRLLEERGRHKETRVAEAEKAYKEFLHGISEKYYALFRDVINRLATADCLMSLAVMSLDGDFSKPEFVELEGSLISIEEGRHPIIEQVRIDPFVPNSIEIGGKVPRTVVISGPNMGGKSSIVRMVALLVLMAQVGSYVPAKSMRLSVHDAILIRMGASDDIAAGRSTFMVELSETKEIISSATEKSLIVLDELGVGTSTFDGMAIAGAVLEHICQNIQCKTLFITHYPSLALELEARYPTMVCNRHMGFIEDTRIDGRKEIRLLYRLVNGICETSFGIECARLAGIPDSVLDKAGIVANNMQGLIDERMERSRKKSSLRLICKIVASNHHTQAEDHMEELKLNLKLLGCL